MRWDVSLLEQSCIWGGFLTAAIGLVWLVGILEGVW